MHKVKFDLKKSIINTLTFLVILFGLSAILEPILIEKAKSNWEGSSVNISFEQSQIIQEAIDTKSSEILALAQSIKKQFAVLDSENRLNDNSIYELVLNKINSAYSLQISNTENELIAWNHEPPLNEDKLDQLDGFYEQTFFVSRKLKDYLAVIIDYQSAKQKFKIITASLIGELSIPTTKNNEKIKLIESLRRELKADITVDIGFDAKPIQDGRIYSFPVLNNYKNKIAIASFQKPSLNQFIENYKYNLRTIQNIIVLLFVWIASFECYRNSRKMKSNLLRFVVIGLLIIGNRSLLFFMEIPSAWINGSITDSSNFSSRFAGGIVRSPLEFFISAVSFFAVALYGYKSLLRNYKEKELSAKQNWLVNIVILLMMLFVYMLLWRGFGAVLRSVIFDSTIRYFKEFTLIPSDAVFLMCLNILIFGFTIFLCSLAILFFTGRKLQELLPFEVEKILILFFGFVQIAGFLFDRMQAEPQGTDLIRILFFTFSFIILYFLFKHKKEFVYKYFLYAFASAIISVSLLTYYNSHLEKESLKNTAYDLVRVNEEQIQFILYQTLVEAQNNSELITSIIKEKDCSKAAFSLWLKSLIYKEGIIANISIYNESKEKKGSFSSISEGEIEIDKNMLDQVNGVSLKPRQTIYSNVKQIDGVAAINQNNSIIGYVAISALINPTQFSHESLVKIFVPERVGVLSAFDYENLKVYEFVNKELVRFSKENNLRESDYNKIFGASYNSAGEAWLEMEVSEEKNLLFILRNISGSVEKIYVIAREIKNFTWNISDFFKIFFIHAVIISFASLFFILFKLKSNQNRMFSFRTKLIVSFMLISIIPLLLIAVYIRNITEERNNEALTKIMQDNIGQFKNYLEPYLQESDLDKDIIFNKAAKDLGKKFSVYKNNSLIYSTKNLLYNTGLFGGKLMSEAYYNLVLQNNSFYVGQESVQGIKINSAFGKIESAEETFVIEVNDLLNKTLLPISEYELDVFLFGVFSFALIIIIAISTVLSGQISSPIKRLTNATRAVSNGDFSVEVVVKSKSELGELANGFNMMVQKIKQSQTEIARFEREEAWREMAKQVAHEIKNPLTPMKLSIQQLATAYNDKSPMFNQIFDKVTTTIIAQIETLKNIASEFSNFARMPRASLTKLNVVEITSEIVKLYEEQSSKVIGIYDFNELYVISDADHLKRTMVNLIRNSFQADADKIVVTIKKEGSNCIIKISDNGKGIPNEVLPEIFKVNFTTKRTGMGLGLSMARKYIESINGNIQVESTDSSGTTFVISIPLA